MPTTLGVPRKSIPNATAHAGFTDLSQKTDRQRPFLALKNGRAVSFTISSRCQAPTGVLFTEKRRLWAGVHSLFTAKIEGFSNPPSQLFPAGGSFMAPSSLSSSGMAAAS
jgi:hypothetical protein